jgi:hypothetical protein
MTEKNPDHAAFFSMSSAFFGGFTILMTHPADHCFAARFLTTLLGNNGRK